jgi:hypothetical protein
MAALRVEACLAARPCGLLLGILLHLCDVLCFLDSSLADAAAAARRDEATATPLRSAGGATSRREVRGPSPHRRAPSPHRVLGANQRRATSVSPARGGDGGRAWYSAAQWQLLDGAVCAFLHDLRVLPEPTAAMRRHVAAAGGGTRAAAKLAWEASYMPTSTRDRPAPRLHVAASVADPFVLPLLCNGTVLCDAVSEIAGSVRRRGRRHRLRTRYDADADDADESQVIADAGGSGDEARSAASTVGLLPHRNPRLEALCVANVELALTELRKHEPARVSGELLTAAAAEQVARGDTTAILLLLEDVMRLADGVPPRAAGGEPYVGRRAARGEDAPSAPRRLPSSQSQSPARRLAAVSPNTSSARRSGSKRHAVTSPLAGAASEERRAPEYVKPHVDPTASAVLIPASRGASVVLPPPRSQAAPYDPAVNDDGDLVRAPVDGTRGWTHETSSARSALPPCYPSPSSPPTWQPHGDTSLVETSRKGPMPQPVARSRPAAVAAAATTSRSDLPYLQHVSLADSVELVALRVWLVSKLGARYEHRSPTVDFAAANLLAEDGDEWGDAAVPCWVFSDGVVLARLAEVLCYANANSALHKIDRTARTRAARRHNIARVLRCLQAERKVLGEYLFLEDALAAGDVRAVVLTLRALRAAFRLHGVI